MRPTAELTGILPPPNSSWRRSGRIPLAFILLAGGISAAMTLTAGQAGEVPGRNTTPSGAAGAAPGSTVQAPGSAVQPPGSAVQAPGSAVQAPGSAVQAPGSTVQAPGSAVQAPGAVSPDSAHSGSAVTGAPASSAASRAPANAPRATVTASLVLKVTDREQTADLLVKKTRELEGYFSARSDESVTLKVPVEQVKTLVAFAEPLGVVVERQYNTEDLGFDLDQKRARLASRESLLGRYYSVLNESGSEGVVQVQTEITHLIDEIDTLKGAVRLLEHKLRYAQVTIAFQFRDRAAPARDGRSSFPWLNSMNLADLVEDFRR